MYKKLKYKVKNLLIWSQKYTHTDMIYIAKGGLWLSLNKIITSVGSLILAIAYANLLSKTDYGLYKYVLSIAGILSLTALPGLNTALTRSVARGYENDTMRIIKKKFKWSLLGSLAGLIISAYYFHNGNSILGFCFLIAGTLAPTTNGLIVHGSFLKGRKLFKQSAIYSTIIQVSSAILIIITLIFYPKVTYLITVFYLSSLIIQTFFSIYIYKKFKLNKKRAADTISFGKHLTIIDFFGTITNNIDKIIMWHFLGAAQLAIYSFATVPIKEMKSFFNAISTLAMPKMASKDKNIIKKTLPSKIVKMTLLLIIPTILYILFSPLIFKILFPQYLDSVKYSQVFAISVLLTPYILIGTTFTSQGLKKQLYYMRIFGAVLKIILLLPMIVFFGIWGAIISIIITNILLTLFKLYLFKRM
ncbi:MAG: oligosaccharide flippase family protein [Candidatus Magasanikbacteria bacterium]|nr:oligosaccharide flippase family protein [Candidatus Magasanikbacteria bacterium]